MDILRFFIKYCNPQSEEEYNIIVNSLLTGNNLDRILASFDYERLSTDLVNGFDDLTVGYASLLSSGMSIDELESKALLLSYLRKGIQQLSSSLAHDKKDLLRFLICSQILSSSLKELGLPSPFDEDPMNPTGMGPMQIGGR